MPNSTDRRAELRRRALASLAEITPEEEAAITAGAESDPDNPILTDEDFARMTPSRGRPRLERPKVPVTLRLDADVVDRFKATGAGWQSRMNEALKKAAG